MQDKRIACLPRERRTEFVEIFRTTPAQTVCPNFYVLRHANGCTFTPLCTYCYLKSTFWYLNAPQVFTNIEEMVEQVRAWIGEDNLESYMLNTGNLSDSLGFEGCRPVMNSLVELFRQEAEAKGRQHTLLVVTKGSLEECRNLLPVSPCRNVVVSFSVNDPAAAQIYESGAAPVVDRLQAAAELKSRGWRLRIRIDPMIQGFNYREIACQVAQLVPERVTLGTLRAEPHLPRFVENGLFREMEQSGDPKGLMRYPQAIRLSLYRQAIGELRTIPSIGLCEETPEIWNILGLAAEEKCCNCCP